METDRKSAVEVRGERGIGKEVRKKGRGVPVCWETAEGTQITTTHS